VHELPAVAHGWNGGGSVRVDVWYLCVLLSALGAADQGGKRSL
jgi:hypothetical protein